MKAQETENELHELRLLCYGQHHGHLTCCSHCQWRESCGAICEVLRYRGRDESGRGIV